MKKEYSDLPESMKKMEMYGFSWMDFVTAIPSPIFVVTTYKSNGMPNACLQSWSCFSGNSKGFYAVLSNVNKSGHMYNTILDKGVAVINFPSADIYDQCLATVVNNDLDSDEITSSGLTVENAIIVDAPRIKECFVNLECRYLWSREIKDGDPQVLMCLEIVNISANSSHLDEFQQGRYGENGYLYNIHYPVSPEKYEGKSHDWIATLKKLKDMGEY